MKRFQSVLCTVALSLALYSTVLAGDIHSMKASGDIHGARASGILISEVFAWGDITGAIMSSFGIILGN